MVTLLAKFFIKNNLSEDKKRTAYGVLCGVVGIILNVILFSFKLFAGLISGAVSITADAFNNLSDAGSSVVTLLGFRIASKKPDREHPYGHGRMEYISGFVVSVIIIVMGFELIKGSIEKIIHPEEIEFSWLIVIILIVSILVKCYMAFYNIRIGKKLNSASLKATAFDSLSDSIATTVVLASTIIFKTTGLNLDGYSGVIVSLFIFYAGYSAAKDALEPLLGNPPEQEFIDKISDIVLSFNENIVGLHDLMVHDYGPGRRIISLHAEVPDDGNILFLHDIIDNLEKKLGRELGCTATIHMDPVAVNNPEVDELRKKVSGLVKNIHENATIHDFRIVKGDTHTNLIFDMVIPYDCDYSDSGAAIEARRLVKENIGKNYYVVINIDRVNLVHS